MNKIFHSDCLEGMKSLESNSVDCCVTSPPYFGLRDYGHEGQIGLEETPEMFVDKMVEVFEQVKRVLKPEGTLWLNLGDSYAGGGGFAPNAPSAAYSKSGKYGQAYRESGIKPGGSVKAKDLVGIPWMVAFALRSAGWYLRQDIIWHKPNPMPESVTDRCTKAHEYIFLLSKSSRYYYDHEAIKQPFDPNAVERYEREKNKGMTGVFKSTRYNNHEGIMRNDKETAGVQYGAKKYFEGEGANKRSVWTVTTKPFSEAHFATFPEDLIVDCIKAGCPEFVCSKCGKAREKIVEKEYMKHDNWFGAKQTVRNDRGRAGNSYNELVGTNVTGLTDCGCGAEFVPGVCLDPFMGAGTTALVARKLNRNYIGFELNAEYIKIANKRLQNELGMFL